MNDETYQLGDLLHYFPNGQDLPTKSAIFVGREHIYCKIAPEAWDFDAVITLLDDGRVRPLSVEQFSIDGQVRAQRLVPEQYKKAFSEFLSIWIESRDWANCPKKDFAWAISDKFRKGLEKEGA